MIMERKLKLKKKKNKLYSFHFNTINKPIHLNNNIHFMLNCFFVYNYCIYAVSRLWLQIYITK